MTALLILCITITATAQYVSLSTWKADTTARGIAQRSLELVNRQQRDTLIKYKNIIYAYQVFEIIESVVAEPDTNEEADAVFIIEESLQAVRFNVSHEGPYDDGAGNPPIVGIYKNGLNSKIVKKGAPTFIPFDTEVSNEIGFQMGSGVTVIGGVAQFKVLENNVDKTSEWGTGSKVFAAGVLPNIKFIYVNPA